MSLKGELNTNKNFDPAISFFAYNQDTNFTSAGDFTEDIDVFGYGSIYIQYEVTGSPADNTIALDMELQDGNGYSAVTTWTQTSNGIYQVSYTDAVIGRIRLRQDTLSGGESQNITIVFVYKNKELA